MKKVTSHIITTLVKAGFKEGLQDYIKLNKDTNLYDQKFHLTIMQAKSDERPFDGP